MRSSQAELRDCCLSTSTPPLSLSYSLLLQASKQQSSMSSPTQSPIAYAIFDMVRPPPLFPLPLSHRSSPTELPSSPPPLPLDETGRHPHRHRNHLHEGHQRYPCEVWVGDELDGQEWDDGQACFGCWCVWTPPSCLPCLPCSFSFAPLGAEWLQEG